jgi:hypothetical protein
LDISVTKIFSNLYKVVLKEFVCWRFVVDSVGVLLVDVLVCRLVVYCCPAMWRTYNGKNVQRLLNARSASFMMKGVLAYCILLAFKDTATCHHARAHDSIVYAIY